VFIYTSYCFSFRSLNTSKENFTKFPSVRNQSISHSISFFCFINSVFRFSIQIIHHFINVQNHSVHLFRYLDNVQRYSVQLFRYLDNVQRYSVHLFRYLDNVQRHSVHLFRYLGNVQRHSVHLFNYSNKVNKYCIQLWKPYKLYLNSLIFYCNYSIVKPIYHNHFINSPFYFQHYTNTSSDNTVCLNLSAISMFTFYKPINSCSYISMGCLLLITYSFIFKYLFYA